MTRPNPNAVKRLARYMRARMPALLMHGNPHEALAEWLLSDVLPYGMEIMQTGDIESIDEREALRSQLVEARLFGDTQFVRASRLETKLAEYRSELRRLYDDEIEDERYGTWHSPTEPS